MCSSGNTLAIGAFVVVLSLIIQSPATVADSLRCNGCTLTDSASCSSNQKHDHFCARDKDSLGTTHCGTAVGKYLEDDKGDNSTVLFYRGCFNCSSKKEACFALGGFAKGNGRTLLQCEIECCTNVNCNNQFPTLSENAIAVFTPKAPGPTKCKKCLAEDEDACSTSLEDQTCSSDSDSLGTTHCSYADIKIRDKDGSITTRVMLGCINCADKKAACAIIGGYLKSSKSSTLLDCNIGCCTGTFCYRRAAISIAPSVLGNRGFHAFVLAIGIILHHF